MKAKINDQMICIPPYVSTSWDHVTFMQAKDNTSGGLDLVMHLDSGAEIVIQNLDKALIDLAFSAHLKYMEANPKKGSGDKNPANLFSQFLGMSPEQMENMPIRLGFGNMPGMENIEMAMQHDESKSDSEPLPKEILDRVGEMTKMIVGDQLSIFPQAHPHCNCPHCQIARAIHGETKEEEAPVEEVSEQDLQFQNWSIEEMGSDLYRVTNPLDSDEQYQVYLGTPVGCTCGKDHCEHIKAVLRS